MVFPSESQARNQPTEDWSAYLTYEATSLLSFASLTLGFSLRAEGSQNVPPVGPALLIANHQSFMDPLIVGVAARRHLRFLARSTLFKYPFLAWLMRQFRTVPVNQEGFARAGLKTVLDELEAGEAIAIFPEGERTGNGAMHPLQPGIHLLISRVQMPIVPVGIAGAYDAWPRWHKYPMPAPLFLPAGKGTIAVSIGRPIDSRRFLNQARDQVLSELLVEVQKMAQRAERLRRKT